VTRRQTRRGIILLALLAVLSWLYSRPSTENAQQRVDRLDTRLNYALYDFNGRLLSDEGDIKLEIESPVLRNDAQSGIGTVDSPQFRILQEQDRWYISAESAVIAADRENVTLAGEVQLTRTNSVTGETLQIQTRDVMLQVTPRTARTESRVSIVQGQDRLDALGMRLDMIANHFELLSEVEAHYDVP
jgi:LPS export ABC transporter protein LptC